MSPGAAGAIGTTTVNGSYTQGASASATLAASYTSAASVSTFGTAANWNTATSLVTTAGTITHTGASARTVTVGSSTTVHALSLAGTSAPLTLEVAQGVQLGVANQLVVGAGATLSGGGRVIGSVVVSGGTVSPGASASAATLTVTGDVSESGASAMAMDLAGAGQSDALKVSGSLTLAGSLTVSALGGYVPQAGDTFDLFDAGSVGGSFNSVTLPALGTGLTWDTSALNSAGLLTVATPEPTGLALLEKSLALVGARRRRAE